MPLVVLHGGPGNTHDPLKAVLQTLTDERPVIFYDQLGSGNSDRPTDPLSKAVTDAKNVIVLRGGLGEKEWKLINDEVFSLTEAASYWGLTDGATIRKAIERGKFREGEVRKSDSVNLITYPAMQRVFGAFIGPCLFLRTDMYNNSQVRSIISKLVYILYIT